MLFSYDGEETPLIASFFCSYLQSLFCSGIKFSSAEMLSTRPICWLWPYRKEGLLNLGLSSSLNLWFEKTEGLFSSARLLMSSSFLGSPTRIFLRFERDSPLLWWYCWIFYAPSMVFCCLGNKLLLTFKGFFVFSSKRGFGSWLIKGFYFDFRKASAFGWSRFKRGGDS